VAVTAAAREALGIALRVKRKRQDVTLDRLDGRVVAEQDPRGLAHLPHRAEHLLPPIAQGCLIEPVPGAIIRASGRVTPALVRFSTHRVCLRDPGRACYRLSRPGFGHVRPRYPSLPRYSRRPGLGVALLGPSVLGWGHSLAGQLAFQPFDPGEHVWATVASRSSAWRRRVGGQQHLRAHQLEQ
jgi:hypothetical protein